MFGLGAALMLAAAPAIAVGSGVPVKATQRFACHGADDLSRAPDAPNLAGQNEQYLIKALQNFCSDAWVHEVMSMMAKGLSDQDTQAVSAYFSAIAISVKALQSCRRAPSFGATSAGQVSQAGITCGVLSGFVMMLIRIIVLDASAGGGFPRWSCSYRDCAGYRAGTARALARTQPSIAISTNGLDWLPINASPGTPTQIRATSALQLGRATRDTGIAAVLLMDAQVNRVTGLMALREGGRLRVYCTASVWENLTERLPLTRVPAYYRGTDWQPIMLDTEAGLQRPFEVAGIYHLCITPFPLSSKAPPYSPRRLEPGPGDNIGILLEDTYTRRKTFYAPGPGIVELHIAIAMAGADCVLVDGTFWTEDEMVCSGLSSKLAHEMGRPPPPGDAGMLAFLNTLDTRRKIVIHINNSNPILDDDSAERIELIRYGVEVTYDGMEIEL